jgi:excisionase family DNA binding protein
MKTLDSPKAGNRPSEQDISLAKQSACLFKRRRKAAFTVHINDEEVTLPGSLAQVLGDCLQIIAEGQSVAVVPAEDEIGTQEAADLLGVSRPFLVKLLDSGVIPSRKVGVQRRVLVADVVAYQKREKDARRKVLAELAREGQRLGLGE